MDQPDQREFTKEFGSHVSIALVVMFALSTSAQVFSRVISTTGGWFLGFYFIGAQLAFALYVQIKISVTGQVDAIPIETTIAISCIWFSLHGVGRAWRKSHGIEIHSHDPGRGLFSYPSLPPGVSIFISDATVAIGLACLFHVMNSPIQRDWFVWIVLPSITITQAWVQYRQAFIRQRFIDATAEASQYADTIGRR